MEGLKLSDQEQRFYGELFQTCDSDVSGKISGIKALELFRASGLKQEALHQITELCGAKRLGHFGRSQFYIALKLIAVGQAGLPVKLDSLNSGVDIALPKFTKVNEQGERRWPSTSDQEVGPVTADGKASGTAGQLPPPPSAKKSHTRSLSGQYRGVVTEGQQPFNAQQPQTTNKEESNDSKSPPFSPRQSPPASPPAVRRQLLKQQTAPATYPAVTVAPPVSVKMASLDGGHVNPVALAGGAYLNSTSENGNWALFEDEDSHMLLGAGVKKWDHLEPPGFDSSSISSEAESVDDIWAISEEQREYYMKQFKTMQPDLGGVITGKVAKDFFEKSKLPVVELSKIWQLSDLNRDGALSLEEFCIAMHLVVLRRNEIELPERLPLSLMPYATLTSDEPFAADLPPGSTLKRTTPPSPQASQDSKIIHPVAVRMSPDGHPIAPEGFDRGRALSDPGSHDCAPPDSPDAVTPTKQRSNTESYPDPSQSDPSAKYNTPLHGRPRPIAKKQNPVPMVVRGHIQPPPLTSHEGGPDRPHALMSSVSGESALVNSEPPAPPPRPPGTHGRSMSVDLKPKTEGGHYSALLPPPAVPPRVSPKDAPSWKSNEGAGIAATEGGADRAVSFSEPRSPTENTVTNEVPKDAVDGSGDFSTSTSSSLTVASENKVVSPLPREQQSVAEEVEPGKPQHAVLTLRQASRDKRELHMAVRTHTERNAMLTRLNCELNQELQEVMEQRIALEIQLEHLRPFSS
ncbi:ralBP1-associated Eps domain-containing protein 1-like isoform X4 [Haliotis rufescens]|uniref:ralBP1-associated Eps domain-containing protein 1-like isoform X4 n=1 Tax=Haliotis rufescens TaxID=6454 RepID=UPI001EB068C0|nr:ralBP1-associated Eps domain-containing protein 1-like isoform X4 [Haliotis rufescens]